MSAVTSTTNAIPEVDWKLLTVDQFFEVRTFISRKLAEASGQSRVDTSKQAEHLMRLGVIDFRAVDRLVHPIETVEEKEADDDE